ncbi:MAG: DUF354 domain-containing protein [Bacteroidota bacterium]|nr:DUF354 domain-containing protein [Bacteroidota bacterium]
MKIWVDFINTPQVSFILPFIEDLSAEGHEFILTARNSGNTVELLKLHGLRFEVIGKDAGQCMRSKILHFPLRILELWWYMRKHKPDVAFCQSSFYLPVVASLLRVPSIYTNDNEYAKGNFVAFIFAKRVILPEVLKEEAFTSKRYLRRKLSFYPGVKEAIYLSQNHRDPNHFLLNRKEQEETNRNRNNSVSTRELVQASELNSEDQIEKYSEGKDGGISNSSTKISSPEELKSGINPGQDSETTSHKMINIPPDRKIYKRTESRTDRYSGKSSEQNSEIDVHRIVNNNSGHNIYKETEPKASNSHETSSEKKLRCDSDQSSYGIIFFRPEPFSAQYYKGPKYFLDGVLINLADKHELIVLPRDRQQAEHYNDQRFGKVKVADRPVILDEIVQKCMLFIGAGGSMTRELAVLGVPVISVYQDSMLKVDHYLMEKGLINLNPQITTNEILNILNQKRLSVDHRELMKEGAKSYNLIKSLIKSKGHG